MNLPPLVPGTLVCRYQRFLADVRLDGGEAVTAHCANTGSMLGLKEPGFRVWLSRSDNPKRKLAWTWELVEPAPGVLCGIHTGRANALVLEALEAGLVPELAGFRQVRREPPLGDGSRSDLRLDYDHGACHVEVKNVTAAARDGIGFFPDAVSVRAVKHLRELASLVDRGGRAAVVFCVQRPDVARVRPARHIDPVFAAALVRAAEQGVELYALGARVVPQGITLERRLAVDLA
ncbi:MAG: DNA/RNA nuclease SfsA [Thiobacillus sp.]|nr:DNA/RNA nuclease SfsA [Thiobacillus sp.]